MTDTAALALSALAMGTATASLVVTLRRYPGPVPEPEPRPAPAAIEPGAITITTPVDDPEAVAKRILQNFEAPRSLHTELLAVAPVPEEKQFEPSPFLTAHQRTNVLRIAREVSIEAAELRQVEYLATRHGRRVRSQA